VEQQEKLFDSFAQADSKTSRKFGGTGLGLAISKRIVEMMGGSIHLKSEPGKGATFSFTVELREGTGAVEELEYTFDGETSRFTGSNLLIAEDVDINREIIMSLLEPLSVTMEFAVNGREAVEKFSAAPEKYDVILMDVQMPEMDGYEATLKIRTLEKDRDMLKHIPIIAMTANVFREDIEKCLAAGMDDHIGKPIEIKEVLEKLGKFLPRK